MNIVMLRKIELYKGWYWVEVSGAMEYFFKKYDVCPLSDTLVAEILGKKLNPIGDGIHYITTVGEYEIPCYKAVYVYKNEDVYNKVLNEVDNYDRFKDRLNRVDENTGLYTKDVNKATMIIANIDSFYFEDGFNEMSPFWYQCLQWAVKTLLEEECKKEVFDNYIRVANDLLDDMPLLMQRIIK